MFNKLKGTRDIFGETADIFNYIKNVFFSFTENYNYKFIETPIIEDANLFIRSAGETSDIVNKEMYIFKDNNQQLIALRPEATASTIRAYVQNKINNFDGDNKFYYFGPMFRYERPQKGRYRQFYQGGVELIAPKSSLANFEIIKLAYDFLTKLKINDFIIEINNLGSFDSRNKYILDLKKYFTKYKDELSVLSQERLDKNVLRIFDDKVDGEKYFVKKAPILWDYLSNEEKENIAEVVGVGAIKYFDLSQNRSSGITFTWDKVLSFEGNTGPYLQYCYVRIMSILRKAKDLGIDYTNTEMLVENSNELERSLVVSLHKLPFTTIKAFETNRPNLIADYLFDLTKEFNSFYNSNQVIDMDNLELTKARLEICEKVALVIKKGLSLLGIGTVERM